MKSSKSFPHGTNELIFYLSYYKSFKNVTYLINLVIQVFIKPDFYLSALHEMTNAYHFLSL